MAKRRKNQQNKAAANAAQQNAQSSGGAQQPNGQAAPLSASSHPNQEEEAKTQSADMQQQPCGQCSSCRPHQQDHQSEIMEDDPTMVQAKFNISETVEVVHMGAAQQQQTQQQFMGGNAKQQAAAAAQNVQRFAQQNQAASAKGQQCANQKAAAPMHQQAGPTKPGQWNPANQSMGAKYHKSQYHQGQEPYGKQPVVTMHDLIDQDERQNNEKQKAQRTQAAAVQGTGQPQPSAAVVAEDMGACEADDEEGEEESEDEDTEEEGIYGPEEGNEDDISEEIEEEHHQWAQHTQATNATHYRQPGAAYQNQPGQAQRHQQPADGNPQYYQGQAHGAQGAQNQYHQQQHYGNAAQNAQPASQQHYQQHAQGHQQQRSQAQQNDNQIENRLHQCLTDMLINLYNGKGTEEYRENYAHVVTTLDEQRRHDVNQDQPYINISQLQNLFENKIESIVGTVRDKLQEDAKKDNLVVEEVTEQAQANADPALQAMQDSSQGVRRVNDAPQKELKVKEYRGDLQRNFDEILSAVGDYFDLFKNNTDKLEALWLQLLDYLNVRNSNQCRIFRRMHYTIYINTVIKNKIIMAIIKEATRWNGTPHASKQLKEHLDKIHQIENERSPIPETYESFNRKKSLDFDLNEYTRTDFILKQQQLELQQKNQQMRQAQSQDNAKGANGGGGSNAICQHEWRDCRQFQDHQRQNQGGKCMCRCQAKNCGCHYQNFAQKGQRANQQKRGTDKRGQGKKFETQSEQSETVDKQFTNMNIDDLMDYILQPQPESKKNKKKQKKRKGTLEEPEEDPVKTAKTGQPQPVSQPNSSSNGSGGKNATQPAPAQSKPRKQQSASSGQHSDKESSSVQNRSTSRSKFSSEKNQQQVSSSGKDGQQQHSRSHQGSTTRPESVTCSSDNGSSGEPGSQLKSDQEFEEDLMAFARKLDRVGEQKVANHSRKLRPNYEEPWILKLKMRLETLESKKQHSSVQTPNSSSSSGKTAPPASGHRSKH